MHVLVIHDSKFGNTEKIAEAIARGVGSDADVTVFSTAEAVPGVATLPARPDLLLLGGPTHSRGASAPLKVFLRALPAPLRGVPAACFDTRYRGPLMFMGSAAVSASEALAKAGARVVAPPQSFYMARRGPLAFQQLEPGELDRAEQWGRTVAAAAAPGQAPGRPVSVPA